MYQLPCKRAVKWQEKNPWFGTDNRLTEQAIAVHELLLRDNVAVDSLEYYVAIDMYMRPLVSKWKQEQKHKRK